MGAIYPEGYRQLAHTFVLSCDTESFLLNLLSNIIKVRESFIDM